MVQGGGSGVIFEIDDDSVYIVNNYHVAYYADADEDLNGGSKIGRYICCYLYGSEYMPEITDMDDDGMYVYEYGDSAIECEYVGGSMEADIAVLRADKEDVFAVNPDVRAAEFADGYSVGQAVYAIGNAESYGCQMFLAELSGHDGVNGAAADDGDVGDEDRTGKAEKRLEGDFWRREGFRHRRFKMSRRHTSRRRWAPSRSQGC